MKEKYNHLEVEQGKNSKWIENKVFENKVEDIKKGKNFSIILPPPNVTGKLHLGHAWDGALQDILIRYKKMQGFNSVWIPGMDHAGIATQSKVENLLYEEGISKHDLGREEFLKRTYMWKNEYANHIREQWGTLGLALDYSKEKFTLDDDANKMVNKVFVELYEKGYIYQGYRITNWDPKAMTAISDIEVIHKEIEGAEHYFKYINAVDSNDYLEIMTTRPETMFGDGALAVNPNDNRYKDYVGKEFIIPNTNIKIPVIEDDYVDMEKGSGVVKITMAHDPNDFEVAKRHNLSPRIIMDEDGTMSKNEYVPEEFWGMDRFLARKTQVEKCEELGLLIKKDVITHSVGHSERSGAVVEPLLSKQWYVKMDELAKKSIENQNDEGKVNFFPKRFESTFLTWMENIQDWCISRQLWWGHQIPAWYKGDEVIVSETSPGEGWVQDEDVLDTWFSSALWPMITCNYLEEDNLMDYLYPHSTLVTGYDIIFFWVSRMIFQSLEFTDKRPFDNVLIHGLVRDETGKKMSKSLGNGIDPMEVVDKYGADSLRYFLTTNSTPGQDLRYSEEKIESSWNFLNKLWNIARYILMNSNDIINEFKKDNYNEKIESFDELTNADKSILSKLNSLIDYNSKMMDKYEFTEVGAKTYNFVWEDFASWYLEVSKTILNSDNEKQIYQTKYILLKVLVDILKILHPFVPFITEEIYSQINEEDFLVNQKYPQKINMDFDNKFDDIKGIITSLRNFKAENDIKPSMEASIILERIDNEYFEAIDYEILKRFGKIKDISFVLKNEEVYTKILENITLSIITDGLIDKEAKREKLINQISSIEKELIRSLKMLSNDNFVKNAKKEKIGIEIEKAEKYIVQFEELLNLIKEESIKFEVEVNLDELIKIVNNLK